MISWLSHANRLSDWSQVHVSVAGIGATGFSVADALLDCGARVTILDRAETPHTVDRATLMEVLGAEVRLGPEADAHLPDCDLVVASPGWLPTSPIFLQAQARSIPIWSDVELAWRLQKPDRIVEWLGVTGWKGKTTTARILESILTAAGLTVSVVGASGRPVLETILDQVAYDCLIVTFSNRQLHWANSLSLHSAVVLDLGPEQYDEDEARIYDQVTHSCVYNVDDPRTEKMVEEADVVEGARAIGFTLGIPGVSMLGVVDECLVDRAFIPQRRDSALELGTLSDLPNSNPSMVADALAAASLARSFGVAAMTVRDGLRAYRDDKEQEES